MEQRKRTETLSYVLLGLLFLMFGAVLLALVYGEIKSDYGALVGGFGTTILGMFAVAVGFVWGSSKESQMRKEAENRTVTGPNGDGATIETTTRTATEIKP